MGASLIHSMQHIKTNAPDYAGVAVVLPVLNEMDNIAPLLDRIAVALEGRPYTICLLDDGSIDGTVEYIERRMAESGRHLHLVRRKKLGSGSQRGGALLLAMQWCLHHTDHAIFVEMDGDLSHRPEELATGIRLILEGTDVAIASKYISGGVVVNRPLGRRLVSRICSVAVRSLINWRLRDYSNGYRFYTRTAAELVASRKIRYGSPIYLTEAVAIWMRYGMRVREFPTTYIGRNEGVSKLRLMDLIKAGIAVFEIAVRYHFTGFAPKAIEAVPNPVPLDSSSTTLRR